MRRLIAVAVLFVATFLSAAPAEAFHHRYGWGHHGWGYRGYGWGGYGYRGFYGYRGYGYRGYGYPGYGLGYPGWGYGGIGYGGGYGGVGYGGYGYPCYGVGYYPSYYSMYQPGYGAYSPGYGAANYGGVNLGVPANVGYPLYASTTRGPTTTFVASPAAPIVSRPATATPVVAARPVVTVAANAIQKFLGMSELRPVNLAGTPLAARAKPAAAAVDSFVARFSNTESRRKAERMIAEADELFKTQNFNSALQRYKLAGSTAPDLAEAFWRQGHALVATHNYEQAATAFKRAIALTEDLGRGGFRLSDIYGGAAMTKSQHLESLAEWAISKRSSSDPYFLLGLFLEYDGQPARAEKFFQKASDLAGISGGHIAVFLDPGEPVLLKSVERTAAKPTVTVPVVAISTAREI